VLYASPAEQLYQTPNTMSNGWVVFVDNFLTILWVKRHGHEMNDLNWRVLGWLKAVLSR